MLLVKVKKHHQITLPKNVREKLDIAEGDYLEMDIKNGQIVLRTLKVIQNEKEAARKKASEILAGLHRKIEDEGPSQMEELISEAVNSVRNKWPESS